MWANTDDGVKVPSGMELTDLTGNKITDGETNIVKALLKKNLPVSDWYPNVTVLFNENIITLPGVDSIAKRIINFPLDIDEEKIKEICFNINTTIEGLV